MRTIIIPPGIGDQVWLWMKLVNTGEKFKVVMSGGEPRRGHQLKELLPDLIAEHEYRGIITYKMISFNNIQKRNPAWNTIREQEFYLSANQHVELGRRIEAFFPDLPTSYRLNYHTTESDKGRAKKLLPDGRKYIGIYTSAYSNVRNWGAWGWKEWAMLIKLLNADNIVFVLVGAPYDVGVTDDLIKAMDESGIKYISTIGEPLSVVIEMMKLFSYFCGFPSGLSILNETLGKDGLMFYAPNIQSIINTWADPVRIKEGKIKECLFTSPQLIYDWLVHVYDFNNKI